MNIFWQIHNVQHSISKRKKIVLVPFCLLVVIVWWHPIEYNKVCLFYQNIYPFLRSLTLSVIVRYHDTPHNSHISGANLIDRPQYLPAVATENWHYSDVLHVVSQGSQSCSELISVSLSSSLSLSLSVLPSPSGSLGRLDRTHRPEQDRRLEERLWLGPNQFEGRRECQGKMTPEWLLVPGRLCLFLCATINFCKNIFWMLVHSVFQYKQDLAVHSTHIDIFVFYLVWWKPKDYWNQSLWKLNW